MLRNIVVAIILLLLSFIIGGCRDTAKVIVSLEFQTDNNLPILENVSVISGGDKFHWHTLTANTETEVVLSPGIKSLPQLTLIYTLNGEKKYWEGPEIAMGIGFTIDIQITALGSIEYKYCINPCVLS